MLIGLAIQEILGIAFGLAVIVWSCWLVYYWAIKPDRERRRQDALHATEEMHRDHWDHLRSGWVRRDFRKSKKPSKGQNSQSSRG